jgi:hypothetical protein
MMSVMQKISVAENCVVRACIKSLLCEQLLQTMLCMMTVSMEAPLSEQAGFQILNSVGCFWLA